MMPISGKFYSFTKDNVDKAPDEKGVYALYYTQDVNEPTYIGSSNVSMRDRLQRHQSGAEGECTQISKWYKREYAVYPHTREKELIDEYKRNHDGNLPPCNDINP